MRRRLAGLIRGEAAKRISQLQIIGTVMTEDIDAGQDQFLLLPASLYFHMVPDVLVPH